MITDELRGQITFEFGEMEKVLAEINLLIPILKKTDCSTRDKAAAASFLYQCHMGILKRILDYRDIDRPSGPDSHIELVKFFGPDSKPESTAPLLFDKRLFHELSSLCRMRHFVLQGYSFQLDREILYDAACRVQNLNRDFKASVDKYIESQAGME
jgi:hypothetical protein